MSMHFEKKLPIPSEIKQRYPLSGKVRAAKEQRDKEIRDIFTGKDDRFILIIGPCSADNEDAVMDYICRLKKVQEQVSDRILIIPRIYTNKPRTTGKGYKGLLHQPDPTKKPDLLAGIIAIRELHMRSIEEGPAAPDDRLRHGCPGWHEEPDLRRPVRHVQFHRRRPERTQLHLQRVGCHDRWK